MVERRGVGLDLGAVPAPTRRPPPRAARSSHDARPSPGGATSGERLEHEPAVAGDRDVGNAVPAELAWVAVDVDQLGCSEPPVAEAEVERAPR